MSRDNENFKTRRFTALPAIVPSLEAAAGSEPPAPRTPAEDTAVGHYPVSPEVQVVTDPLSETGDLLGLSSTDLAADYDFDRTTERHIVPYVPAGGRLRGALTIMTGFNAGQTFPLDGTSFVLGRGSEADLWIEDPGVSRRHARVSREGTTYFVEDLGSTNGTMVGTDEVRRRELISGDRIRLGPTAMVTFALLDDQEEELRRRLFESSTKDALTRVYNRKYFSERLSAEVSHARRHGAKLALLMIDLDYFKVLNDTHGHLAGDMALRMVAAQIGRLIRVEDLLARYGGEEFVILARSTGRTQATLLAERIRASVADMPVPLHDGEIRCTLSIGVAALVEIRPEAGEEALVRLADERLYRAKEAGRNRVCSREEV